jgi:CheY-like chemotaxis protein
MAKPAKILLVEDDSYDVELTLSALKGNHIANRIDAVRDGEEALDYLFRRGAYQAREAGEPAVVLLDLKLPKVSGLEVLKQVKADPKLRVAPIVVLTSSREEQDLVRSYNLGTNAYVVKPVDFTQFIEAVRDLGLFWAVLNEPPSGSAGERQ